MKRLHTVSGSTLPLSLAAILFAGSSVNATPDSVLPVIRRTEFGVPHIQANDFRGIGIGLGYAMVEDYGDRVILGMVRSKGWMGRTFGRDSMQSDFAAQLDLARVEETYHLLDADTRAMYEGFAEGLNIFIRSQPGRAPAWAKPVFNGHDVAATDIGNAGIAASQRLVLRRLQRDSARTGNGNASDQVTIDPEPWVNPDDGSNAWAFAPSRTKTGNAILLRNPHLQWSAGYWEAHVTIPGKLDFYGDFRIGSPFAVVAGFNANLGWATTNNATDVDEVYRLDADTTAADRYVFDGVSSALRKLSATVEYTAPDGVKQETRTFWTTPLGPVVHRTREHVYIVRSGAEGEYRGGEEFLRMMRARSLAEWKAAVAMRARPTSNLTYADRAGNIFYIWNGSVPVLPHAPGGDSLFVPAHESRDIWTSLIPTNQLPQILNPGGGYVQNENDAPYYANLHPPLDTARYAPNVERPRLGLRGQLALQLVDTDRKVSLEDVVRLKHSTRMLLADRVKPDLLRALRASTTKDSAVTHAMGVLQRWDNTASAQSRGSLLFETWWRRYASQAGDTAFAEKWTPAKLTSTPRGLGKPELAIEAFSWAIAEMQRRHQAVDIPWGDVHRVKQGNVDVPVGGCSGTLGCFRVLNFAQLPDGRRAANSGDGWVLAIEFAKTGPRAYSVLAYGQSSDSTSPNHADQAAMFARGQLKTVRFTQADVKSGTKREYVPGR